MIRVIKKKKKYLNKEMLISIDFMASVAEILQDHLEKMAERNDIHGIYQAIQLAKLVKVYATDLRDKTIESVNSQ